MAAKEFEVAQLPSKCFHLHGTSLVISGKPTRKEWREAGMRIGKANGATQWWIADWLLYGENQWGEIYDEAMKITGLSYSHLANIKYTASQIHFSARAENLTFKHHEIVAPLKPPEQKKWLDFACNGHEGPISVASLRRAIKESQPSDYPPWLCCSDVWNIPDCDSRFGIDYPGRIPGQVLLNVLYYFGCPGNFVVDPMAGGGTTLDVCKNQELDCEAFDFLPSRPDIKKHDATLPWKIKTPAGLIFIDPPYGSQQSDQYQSMAEPAETFLKSFAKVINHSVIHLHGSGHLAILIAPMSIKESYKDLPFEIVKLCEARNLVLHRRIAVPVSTQQVGPRVVQNCKENKIMIAVLRDLLIFKHA